MKVKAKEKFNNLEPQAIPWDGSERKALKNGQVVDIDESLAS